MANFMQVMTPDGTISFEINPNPPMTMQLVHVTKALADFLLMRNPRNRTINRVNVDKIKNSLRNGAFEATHQGVALDADFNLVDGQNRLTAISETGISAWTYVFFNAPRSMHIDKGTKRSIRESLYMSGVCEWDDLERNQLTTPLVRYAIERSFGKDTARRMDEQQIHRLYKKHEEMFGEIIKLTLETNGKWGKSSVILYAMLRALAAGVRIEDIREWYTVFTTGMYHFRGDERKTDAAEHIVALRQILENGRLSTSVQKDARISAERKVMSSIRHFISRDATRKIYGEDVYPIFQINPEDLGIAVQEVLA